MKQQRELQCQVKEYIRTLSPEELETLREEAVGQLDEETRRSAESLGSSEMLIQLQIEEIVGKKMNPPCSKLR